VNVRLHLFRGALAVLMLYAFISAVRESSLATTYSIFMFAPLLVAALSVPILGEKVVGGQWAAISVGFVGVLLMLGPVNGQWLSTGSLWAIVGLITYAVAIVSLRLLSRTDSTESMVLGFTVLLMVGAGALAIPDWHEVRWAEDFKLILGVGLMGSIGQQLITVAFRNAPAAVVAPFEYTALVWGVLLDIAIWSVYPSALTLMGGSIVIGAGLYLIQRERRAAAQAQEAPTSAS
jgi:drug/metabolite transporter (DMT)-like permease